MNFIAPDIFTQLHVDVCRNSTDDFNLFHDSHRWHRIVGNPFNGPIILGFQLGCLIEGKLDRYRKNRGEDKLIAEQGLTFSNYQFSFASAIKPRQVVEIEIKESQFKSGPEPVLSNRLIVKADGKLALVGSKRESRNPAFLSEVELPELGDLRELPDRSFLGESCLFLKRKFMTTSNAKNFLCGSLRDQTESFDELEDKVEFPEMFPCSLISSALLEKARKLNHDFERNPMIYANHKICVDRRVQAKIRSADALHILIKPTEDSAEHDFGGLNNTALNYGCYGFINGDNLLFRAVISLIPLEILLKGKDRRLG